MTACDLPRAPSPFCPPLCAGFRRVAAMFGAPARTTGPGGANPRVKGLAERVGFEPTEVSLSGFQDRRIQPLCHLSPIEKDAIFGHLRLPVWRHMRRQAVA